MTKADLINALVEDTSLPKKDCEAFLNSFTAQITKSLKDGNDVSLIGFGSFTVKDRPARTGRNPRTGDEIKIAACKAAGFKAGKPLKEAINK
jgi:DNA-binding protein HU-beta